MLAIAQHVLDHCLCAPLLAKVDGLDRRRLARQVAMRQESIDVGRVHQLDEPRKHLDRVVESAQVKQVVFVRVKTIDLGATRHEGPDGKEAVAAHGVEQLLAQHVITDVV